MNRKKLQRKELQRKKQILFLAGIVVLLVAGTVLLLVRSAGERRTISYHENSQEEIVEYDGRRYRYNDHLSNYLFLGIDSREPVETYEGRRDAGQADAIFLLSFDRAEETLQCLVIPRDTMTDIRIYAMNGADLGTIKDHINLQYAYGDGRHKSCELMKEAVTSMLYGIPIEGYCSLNMDGIPLLSQVIGEVEVTVPNDSLENVAPSFYKGAKVRITEENVEQFVRYRDIKVSQSAITRTERQKVFLKAAAVKAQQTYAEDASLVGKLYERLEPYMVTNLGNDIFARLLTASYDPKEGVQTLPGTGEAGEVYDVYHIDDSGLFELILQMFYEQIE